MRRWWDELVVDFYDRMDGFVALTHRGRLDADEHELAVHNALIKFSTRLIETFRGVSTGELVNATRTLCVGVCIDVQRSSMRARGGPALEEATTAAESARRYDEAERATEVRDFLAWALPQLGEDRRRVLELTFHGAQLPEIMEELGITQANAYQRRSRGMRDLAKLKEVYDA